MLALLLWPVGCGRFGYETLPLVDNVPPLGSAPPPGAGQPPPDTSSLGGSCSDGVQNQDEIAVDCGGVCAACRLGPSATCFDGVQNQGETGADCGGSCAACPVAPTATCSDGAQNQDEVGVDCGGVCAACPVVPTATCSDGVQNQDEVAIDCGGATCSGCIPSSCGEVLADSAADYSDAQGTRGWYYGYYVEPQLGSADFLQLPLYEHVDVLNQDIWRYGDDTWTHMGARVMHPNGRITSGGKLPIEQLAVRRWVSNTAETLFIQGSLQITGASTNGVLARILVGDSEVWQQFVGPGPTSPLAFDTRASVQVGDAVNFVLEAFESEDGGDATDFVVQLCR